MTCNKEKIMSRSFALSYADTHAVTEADEIARDGHVKVVIIDGVQYLSMRDIVQAVTPVPAAKVTKVDQVSVLKIDGINGGRIRMVVKDGVRYLSARDIIRFQCQKNNKQVLQAWDKLNPEFMDGIKECMDLFTFSGSGEANQPVLEVRAALELVMHLECAHAERNRSRMLAALAGVWTGNSGKMIEALGVIRERRKRCC